MFFSCFYFCFFFFFFFFSSRRRHTRWPRDWSSDVCSSDLLPVLVSTGAGRAGKHSRLRPRYVRREAASPPSRTAGRPERRRSLPSSALRSEERRVGKECRSRWSTEH